MYLLDTNVCSGILRGTSPSLAEHLRFVPRTQVRVSSIVKAELLYGARKSGRIAENLRLLEEFFGTVASR
jgi:tRNA(fMet)-specific endonuclease VapC